jgi:hypothetical protein
LYTYIDELLFCPLVIIFGFCSTMCCDCEKKCKNYDLNFSQYFSQYVQRYMCMATLLSNAEAVTSFPIMAAACYKDTNAIKPINIRWRTLGLLKELHLFSCVCVVCSVAHFCKFGLEIGRFGLTKTVSLIERTA